MKFSAKKQRRLADRESARRKINRSVVVIYELSQGRPYTRGDITEKMVRERYEQLGIDDMDDSAFADYKLGVLQKYPLGPGQRL